MLCESLLGTLGGSSNNITSLFLNIFILSVHLLKILIQLISSVFYIMAFGGATNNSCRYFQTPRAYFSPF